MARKVCRGPSNSLLMHRAKNLAGPFFQNTGQACVKGVGNVWAPGGPLSEPKAIHGEIRPGEPFDVYITWSACVQLNQTAQCIGVNAWSMTIRINGSQFVNITNVEQSNGGRLMRCTIPTEIMPGDEVRWIYQASANECIQDCNDDEGVSDQIVDCENRIVLAGDFILMETGGMSIILLEDQSGPDDEDGIKLEDAV